MSAKHGNTWIRDFGVVGPGTQRYVDQGGNTTARSGGLRHGQSGDQDSNFTLFMLETGGRVSQAACDWLRTLTTPEPGEQIPSQDDQPVSRPREATQALQAHPQAREDCGGRSALQTSRSSWNCSTSCRLLC
jgi:hypothetical protein